MASKKKNINGAKLIGILAIVAGAYYLVKKPATPSTQGQTQPA